MSTIAALVGSVVAAEKPNIVIILTDDQDYQVMGKIKWQGTEPASVIDRHTRECKIEERRKRFLI